MTKLTKICITIVSTLLLGTAFADQPSAELAWSCSIDGNVKGVRVGLIIGVQSLKGPGLITCHSADGDYVAEANVNIKISGIGIGLGFTKIKGLNIHTLGIGVVGGPEALIGKYRVGASSGFTFINVGMDIDAAIRVNSDSLGFEIALTGQEAIGLGTHLHGMLMSITLAD